MNEKQGQVGVNGYRLIGKRVADAVDLQDGLTLVGGWDDAIDGKASIESADRALGGTSAFLLASDEPIVHLAGSDVDPPDLAVVAVRHAHFAEFGFKDAEVPSGEDAT